MPVPITAYRFNLVRGDGIQSPIYQGPFQLEESATCRAMLQKGPPHAPPGPDCECGIYAITNIPAYEAFRAWVPGLHRDPSKLAFCQVLLWDAVPSTSPGDVAGTVRGSKAQCVRMWVQGKRTADILSAIVGPPSPGVPAIETVEDLESLILRELSAAT
jgi:hypothetical protein